MGYIIETTDEPKGYFQLTKERTHGHWTSYREDATVFTATESINFPLPDKGQWIRVDETEDTQTGRADYYDNLNERLPVDAATPTETTRKHEFDFDYDGIHPQPVSMRCMAHQLEFASTDDFSDHIRREHGQIDTTPLLGRSDLGLGKLTAADLAQLRTIILAVIDDGDRDCRNWRFYNGLDQKSQWVSEELANDQRLRFVYEIQRRIVTAGAPEVVGK